MLLAGATAACESDERGATAADDRMLGAGLGEATAARQAYPGGGTLAYDVLSYDLDADVTIEGDDRIEATMTIVARAVSPLRTIELDLAGLDADQVTVDGLAARSRQTDEQLIVTPAAALSAGQEFTVVVPYEGQPGGEGPTETLEDGGGWLDLGAYSAVIAQPVGAPSWIPTNDRPSDKATVTITVTVPAPLEAISNGRLVERTDEAGSSTFRWVADEPMAPYLITLAVGEYELVERTIRTSDMDGGITVIDGYPTGQTELAASSFAPFGEMVSFFSQLYGPYPFTTAGNVIVPGMPATALECQTRSMYSDVLLRADDHEELVAHELAHQWFGDAVTPAAWQDVWLNEGPAVFSQWLWTEHTGGRTVRESAANSYDPDDPALDVPIADPGADELFGTAVYERSAIFLVLLRERMGEEKFTTLLRTWYGQHRGANGTTAEFVALIDSVNGAPLTEFTNDWLWSTTLPEADL